MAATRQSRRSKEAKESEKSESPVLTVVNGKLDDEQQLTTHEVGKILQVNSSSIVKWINDGILPAYRTPGGHRRVVVKDLRDFAIKYKMFVPAVLRS